MWMVSLLSNSSNFQDDKNSISVDEYGYHPNFVRYTIFHTIAVISTIHPIKHHYLRLSPSPLPLPLTNSTNASMTVTKHCFVLAFVPQLLSIHQMNSTKQTEILAQRLFPLRSMVANVSADESNQYDSIVSFSLAASIVAAYDYNRLDYM